MTSLTFLERNIFFLVIALLITTSSCWDTECEELFGFPGFSVRVVLEDKDTQEPLVGRLGQRYDPDEGIRVLDLTGNEVDLLVIGDILSFAIEPDNLQIGDTVRNTYFLELPPWEDYPRVDVDTLFFEHTLVAAENDCIPYEAGPFKYFYNDELIFSGTYDELPSNNLYTPK